MPNVKNNTLLLSSPKHAIHYVTLVSDGTQETGYIVHDNSAICSLLGIEDTLNCYITHVKAMINSAAGKIELDFEATTDVLAFPLPTNNGNPVRMTFQKDGGLPNYAGAGKTGDILLKTSGLAAGDMIMLILDVRVS